MIRSLQSGAKKVLVGLAAFGFMVGATAAQHHMMEHASHGTAAPEDSREMVQFPPEMQTNFLGNMRDHMQTLDSIIQALSTGDYAGASKVAAERLGLDSPSAAGCKPKPAVNASQPTKAPISSAKPMTMDEMMEAYMPAAMRGVGMSMHTAATEFAKVASTKDRDASMKALSEVTQNCVACHSSYRLR